MFSMCLRPQGSCRLHPHWRFFLESRDSLIAFSFLDMSCPQTPNIVFLWTGYTGYDDDDNLVIHNDFAGLSAYVTTPLDVIKTRLQVQGPDARYNDAHLRHLFTCTMLQILKTMQFVRWIWGHTFPTLAHSCFVILADALAHLVSILHVLNTTHSLYFWISITYLTTNGPFCSRVMPNLHTIKEYDVIALTSYFLVM